MGPCREKEVVPPAARFCGAEGLPFRSTMVRRGRLVAIEGASASGKTTLMRAAAKTFGWRPLSEAFDRLDPTPSLEFRSSQELLRLEGVLLAEEVRRYREARLLCRRGVTVLADTGFLGPLTYTRGLVELGRAPASVGRTIERTVRALVRRGALGIPDLTVWLDASAAERRRRARGDARRHPLTLFPRHEAVGLVERRTLEAAFRSVLPGRFSVLRGRGRPGDLARHLGELVRAALAPPSSRTEGLALLDRLDRPTGNAAGRASAPTVKKAT